MRFYQRSNHLLGLTAIPQIKIECSFRSTKRVYPKLMRESKHSTNVLKLWLQQHNRNPYPNKKEKTLLAVEANLTVTQVIKALFLAPKILWPQDETLQTPTKQSYFHLVEKK